MKDKITKTLLNAISDLSDELLSVLNSIEPDTLHDDIISDYDYLQLLLNNIMALLTQLQNNIKE